MAAKGKRLQDTYAQSCYVNPQEVVAGVTSYEQFSSQINYDQEVGMIINRVEYHIGKADLLKILDAANDYISAGLGMIPDGNPTQIYDTGMLDVIRWDMQTYGTPANAWIKPDMLITTHDFSSMPGGGLIAHPSALYGYVRGISLASTVASVIVRIWYKTIQLTDAEYNELYKLYLVRAITA